MIWAILSLVALLGSAALASEFKQVVEYEGNIFVLHSGCPEIECQRLPQLDYCKKYKNEYEECMR